MNQHDSKYTDRNGLPYPDCPECGSEKVIFGGRDRLDGNIRLCESCGYGWREA